MNVTNNQPKVNLTVELTGEEVAKLKSEYMHMPESCYPHIDELISAIIDVAEGRR